MSIFFNTAKMPTTCMSCFCNHQGWDSNGSIHCPIMCDDGTIVCVDGCEEFRHPWCPLHELSNKHGRLIDADRLLAIIKSAAGDQNSVPLQAVLDSIEHAPTVIEAESEQEVEQ